MVNRFLITALIKSKVIIYISIVIIMLGITSISVFAATKEQNTSKQNVNFNEIYISGKNTGVELVRTDDNKVSFEFLGVEIPANYATNAIVKDGIMNISVINFGSRPQNVITNPENYQNVIRIYIPDIEYSKFNIDATDLFVSAQDFNAPIEVIGGKQGGFCLVDSTISQGNYTINFKTSYISIEADIIESDITINQENGYIDLDFKSEPNNLYLDTTNCNGILNLPHGWGNIHTIGNGDNKIIINNNGMTNIISK